MAKDEDIDEIFETKSRERGRFEPLEFRSPTLTLGVLRFVGGFSLVGGLLVGVFAFLALMSSRSGDGGYLLAISIGALVQGFIIFALYNALALIVENLIGIRKAVTKDVEK